MAVSSTVHHRFLFVDPQGSDSAGGSSSAPFRTISHAAAIAEASDTVIVRAGTYAEHVDVAGAGTNGQPISFVAEGRVVITGADGGFQPAQWAGDDDMLNQSGDRWVTLQGFTFQGIGEHAIPIRAATGWHIENCTVEDAGFGVNIRGDDVTVDHSIFENINGPNAQALVAAGGTNIRILNNTIDGVNTNNEIASVADNAITKFVGTTGLVVDSNVSENNHGPGLWLDTGNRNFVISHNVLQDNVSSTPWQGGGAWIEADGNANGQVYGNTFARNSGAGLAIFESNGVVIHDNRFDSNGIEGIEVRNLDREPALKVHDIAIHNNTFYGAGYAIKTSIGDFAGYEDPPNKHISADYDVYQNPPLINWMGKVYQGLAAVRAGLGFETDPPATRAQAAWSHGAPQPATGPGTADSIRPAGASTHEDDAPSAMAHAEGVTLAERSAGGIARTEPNPGAATHWPAVAMLAHQRAASEALTIGWPDLPAHPADTERALPVDHGSGHGVADRDWLLDGPASHADDASWFDAHHGSIT